MHLGLLIFSEHLLSARGWDGRSEGSEGGGEGREDMGFSPGEVEAWRAVGGGGMRLTQVCQGWLGGGESLAPFGLCDIGQFPLFPGP